MIILAPLLIRIVINKMVNNWLEMNFRIMMKLTPISKAKIKDECPRKSAPQG
jgi:hypothetical protein